MHDGDRKKLNPDAFNFNTIPKALSRLNIFLKKIMIK